VTVRAGALLAAATVLIAACGSEDRSDQGACCTELRQSIDQNVTVFDPQDPADPAEAEATLDELVALAPSEIEADVVVLRDAFAQLAAAIDDVDLEDASAADRLAGIELDEERIARAQAAMAAYGRDPCRIPLLSGPAAATTSAPTTAPPPTGTAPTETTGTVDPTG
jgi:hypothetical protein